MSSVNTSRRGCPSPHPHPIVLYLRVLRVLTIVCLHRVLRWVLRHVHGVCVCACLPACLHMREHDLTNTASPKLRDEGLHERLVCSNRSRTRTHAPQCEDTHAHASPAAPPCQESFVRARDFIRSTCIEQVPSHNLCPPFSR